MSLSRTERLIKLKQRQHTIQEEKRRKERRAYKTSTPSLTSQKPLAEQAKAFVSTRLAHLSHSFQSFPKQRILHLLLLFIVLTNIPVSTATRTQSESKLRENNRSSKTSKAKAQDASSAMLDAIRHACNASNAVKTVNKAHDVELGMQDVGEVKPLYAPMYCWENRIFKCNDTIAKDALKEDLEAKRQLNLARYSIKLPNVANEIKGLHRITTHQELMRFNQEMEKLLRWIEAKKRREYSEKIGSAGCGEHADIVVDKLRIAAAANPDAILPRVQFVVATEVEDDHAFIVIDNSKPNVLIKQDKKATGEALDQMDGEICDTWNSLQKPVLLASNPNNMYKSGAGWRSIRSKDEPLRFNFEGLGKTQINILKNLYQKYLSEPDKKATAKAKPSPTSREL